MVEPEQAEAGQDEPLEPATLSEDVERCLVGVVLLIAGPELALEEEEFDA